MAERRMFAKTIIDSDAFLDMPLSTQALYFHLSMRADDEGFINNPKRISRTVGASDDELKVLFAKNFIIGFESGVIVIKHWKLHNYIRGDRIQNTVHTEERETLDIKDNGTYTFNNSQSAVTCQADDSIGKDRLGKDRLGKDSIEESTHTQQKRFTPPTLEEVQSRITEMNYSIDAERFMSHYQSNGWMVGRNKMKDWKASLVTWSKGDNKPKQTYQPKQSKTDVTMNAYEELCREREERNNFIDGEIA